MGATYWGVNNGVGTLSTPAGQLCVTVAAGQYALLGWPDGTTGIPLTPGASYTFSYTAKATPSLLIDAKVGHTTAPYATDFDTPAGDDSVPTAFEPFTHPFTAPTTPAETSAGIAFMIPKTGTATADVTVCFESVSVVLN